MNDVIGQVADLTDIRFTMLSPFSTRSSCRLYFKADKENTTIVCVVVLQGSAAVNSTTIVQPGVQTHPELQDRISYLIPASFCPRNFCLWLMLWLTM